jgi:uncharacterized protein YlxW (UPF0749 family)
MLSSILNAISVAAEFAKYVTAYFREKSIRDTQRRLDTQESEILALKAKLKKERKEHEMELEYLEQIYLQKISEIEDTTSASSNPVVGARKISG